MATKRYRFVMPERIVTEEGGVVILSTQKKILPDELLRTPDWFAKLEGIEKPCMLLVERIGDSRLLSLPGATAVASTRKEELEAQVLQETGIRVQLNSRARIGIMLSREHRLRYYDGCTWEVPEKIDPNPELISAYRWILVEAALQRPSDFTAVTVVAVAHMQKRVRLPVYA